MMKVILTADVKDLGHKGDVLEVADGFARNYLIPKSYAIKATAGALREAEAMRKAREEAVRKAKAEARRALAVATEQEMRAREQEMRAKVVEAEADVPRAIAESFRSGNLGIMDYYRLKNIQADTGMRESISKDSEE